MVADHDKVTRLVRTAQGQLDSVLRMIEEDRYCMDVANQLLASQALIRKATREVLRAHMNRPYFAADQRGCQQKSTFFCLAKVFLRPYCPQ